MARSGEVWQLSLVYNWFTADRARQQVPLLPYRALRISTFEKNWPALFEGAYRALIGPDLAIIIIIIIERPEREPGRCRRCCCGTLFVVGPYLGPNSAKPKLA